LRPDQPRLGVMSGREMFATCSDMGHLLSGRGISAKPSGFAQIGSTHAHKHFKSRKLCLVAQSFGCPASHSPVDVNGSPCVAAISNVIKDDVIAQAVRRAVRGIERNDPILTPSPKPIPSGNDACRSTRAFVGIFESQRLRIGVSLESWRPIPKTSISPHAASAWRLSR